MNINKIHLLKRGISTDTYSYYQSKKKNDNKLRTYSPNHSLIKRKQEEDEQKERER